MPAESASTYRYWAFISYCNRDSRKARWLHRSIETYGIPTQLVGSDTPTGPAPRRFYPVFRDRDELPAAASLSTEIDAALRESRHLIVVCSPSAAQSAWVDREVRAFRDMGRGDRILALIVDGDPSASGSNACFPPALRELEPIAADLRRDGDGARRAKLKLLAGMLGVSLDELQQRDAQRQVRRLRAFLGISLLLVAAFGGLAWYALLQRDIAVTNRNHAEDVLAFLVYDLNDELRKISHAELADMIRQRVDDYYRKLGHDPSNLRMLAVRAAADDNAASIAFQRGDLGIAIKGFRASQAIREGLAARDPNEPEWLYLLAISHAHIGETLRAQKDFQAALDSYLSSIAVIERIPKSYELAPVFRHQLAVSYYAVGSLRLAKAEPVAAMDAFNASLAIAQGVVDGEKGAIPLDDVWLIDLANAHEGLGEVWMTREDRRVALEAFLQTALIREQLVNRDRRNVGWLLDAGDIYNRIGEIRTDLYEPSEALEAYQKSLSFLGRAVAEDPDNANAQSNALATLINIATLHQITNPMSAAQDWQRANEKARELESLGIPINPRAAAALKRRKK